MSSIPSLYHQIETKLAHLYGTDQASALLTDIIKLVETMPAGTQPPCPCPIRLNSGLSLTSPPRPPLQVLERGRKTHLEVPSPCNGEGI